jgi:hypothetical protein
MTRETEDFEEGFIRALMQTGLNHVEAEAELQKYLSTTVRKEVILGVVGDLVADLMYYDRKEDECLPRGAIEQAIEVGAITVDEIIEKFAEEMRSNS